MLKPLSMCAVSCNLTSMNSLTCYLTVCSLLRTCRTCAVIAMLSYHTMSLICTIQSIKMNVSKLLRLWLLRETGGKGVPLTTRNGIVYLSYVVGYSPHHSLGSERLCLNKNVASQWAVL